MIVMWAAVSSFIGATLGAIFVEWYRQKNRLRLAAVDKRLEVLQQAWALCRKLRSASVECDYYLARETDQKAELARKQAAHKELSEAVHECGEWLDSHCLYLDLESRRAFMAAHEAALMGYFFPSPPTSSSVLGRAISKAAGIPVLHRPTDAQKKQIKDAPDVITKAAGLPPLSQDGIAISGIAEYLQTIRVSGEEKSDGE